MVNPDLIPIIRLICEQSFTVVYIGERYYATVEFLPAELPHTPFHTLNGLDITDVVKNHIKVNLNDQQLKLKMNQLLQDMLKSESISEKFSSDHTWRWFIK